MGNAAATNPLRRSSPECAWFCPIHHASGAAAARHPCYLPFGGATIAHWFNVRPRPQLWSVGSRSCLGSASAARWHVAILFREPRRARDEALELLSIAQK